MPTIDVNLDGDNAWPELRPLVGPGGEVLHVPEVPWRLAVLEGGMSSGAPSLALRIDFPRGAADGASVLLTETSLAAWIAATCALRGRFPEAFRGTPLEAR